MFPFRLYAATGDAVAQIDSLDGELDRMPGISGPPHGGKS